MNRPIKTKHCQAASNKELLTQQTTATAAPSGGKSSLQLTLFETGEHPLIEEIRRTDLDSMTPLEALQKLNEWREQVHG